MTSSRLSHRSFTFIVVSFLLLAGCEDRAEDASGGDDAGIEGDRTLDSTFPGPVGAQPCIVTFTPGEPAREQGDPFLCEIPIDTGLGCDELARCVCEYARSMRPDAETYDLDACVDSLVVARGAITLADYCLYAGFASDVASIADLLTEHSLPAGIDSPIGSEHRIEASEACREVAAYTLWGEEPAWFMSLLDRNATIPGDAYRVEDYPLESEPLLTMDHVLEFTASEALAVLTTEGKNRLAERFGEAEPGELVGRSFLIHTARTPLSLGAIVSRVMSSTRPGPVLVAEELHDADYGELRFFAEYPSGRPMDFNSFVLGQFAAVGKLTDATCISTCGCPGERACRVNTCTDLPSGCQSDEDCCLGRCGAGGQCQ